MINQYTSMKLQETGTYHLVCRPHVVARPLEMNLQQLESRKRASGMLKDVLNARIDELLTRQQDVTGYCFSHVILEQNRREGSNLE